VRSDLAVLSRNGAVGRYCRGVADGEVGAPDREADGLWLGLGVELGLGVVVGVGLAPSGLGVTVADWLVGLGVRAGSAVAARAGRTSR
jgi:hypothetical protein